MKKINKSTVKQLAFNFSLLLTVIIILFSLAIILLLRFYIRQRQNNELLASANAISNSIKNNNFQLASTVDLPYYITFTIYKLESKEIVYTNDPFLPALPITKKRAKMYTAKNYFTDGDLNILYYALLNTSDKQYVVQTAVNMDLDTSEFLLSNLPKIILFTIIPLVTISFFASLLIAKQTMRRVKDMANDVKNISTSNLTDRLPVSNKNDDFDMLAKTFNNLLQRIQKDFLREKQFTQDVSHELKTPLAVILGHANLINRWGKDDKEQLEKSITSLIKEAHSMESIITNLLQLSKIENGRITVNIKKVNVQSLFERLICDTKVWAPNVKCTMQSEIECVKADEELLYEALTIIISNSVKFAGEYANISLCAKYDKDEKLLDKKQKEKFCKIMISDNGKGISKEALPHIFERFYREDSSHTRSVSGNGLGLAIVKSIMEVLGGSVSAESESTGTTIILNLAVETSKN